MYVYEAYFDRWHVVLMITFIDLLWRYLSFIKKLNSFKFLQI